MANQKLFFSKAWLLALKYRYMPLLNLSLFTKTAIKRGHLFMACAINKCPIIFVTLSFNLDMVNEMKTFAKIKLDLLK